MVNLEYNEIRFHPSSYLDSNGRLFWYKGELYRAISSERAELYRQLFDDNTIKKLIDKHLLIESEVANLELEGYELVIKHRSLPFISYSYEWCAEMLRDAALLIIDLEIELLKNNLTLQDAHSRNVLFDSYRPIFVDLGSIIPVSQNFWQWFSYDEFNRSLIYPLQLMAKGFDREARLFLYDIDNGVKKSDLQAFITKNNCFLKRELQLKISDSLMFGPKINEMPDHIISFINKRLSRTMSPLKGKKFEVSKIIQPKIASGDRKSRIDSMQKLHRSVENIKMSKKQERCSNSNVSSFTLSPEWTEKDRCVHEIILAKHPNTLLDIGCKFGWYSRLAAALGSKVVAIDKNESCISQIYLDGKRTTLSVLPLVLDFQNPSPGLGVCNQEFPSAGQRLKCDMVLFLDLIHKLVFNDLLKFEQIIDSCSMFSNKWLLLEFIPREGEDQRKEYLEKFLWYSVENLMVVIRRQFPNIIEYPSYQGNRILLLCEK